MATSHLQPDGTVFPPVTPDPPAPPGYEPPEVLEPTPLGGPDGEPQAEPSEAAPRKQEPPD